MTARREVYLKRFDEGQRAARKIIRAAKARMKGQSGDYVRGWRAALDEVDYLMKINIQAAKREQLK